MRSNFVIPIVAACCITACVTFAQEKPAQKPEVRVNYLNVCSPSEDEQKEIAAALASIPAKPALTVDFEVSRGRSTVTPASSLEAAEAGVLNDSKPIIARFVRIRHELASGSAYGNAQYSFSVDETGMAETLVLHARDFSRGVIQISLQDSITAGTAAAVLAANTPVDRIRIERNGKPSLVLARCGGADQSRYETVFRTGSEILAKYRALLGVKQIVPGDLARVQDGAGKRSAPEAKR